MGLFAGVPFDQGRTTIDATVRMLTEKLTQLPGKGPHSFCELRPDDSDYDWLCKWAAQLDSSTVTTAGWASGVLALIHVAETARREAQEGFVWPCMRDRFQQQTHRRFFVQGQPAFEFKELLAEAAQRLNLRHVFGREGTQQWYLSIYLQFGFTQRGMGRANCGNPRTF